jgi:hypothetical protein
MIQMNRAAIQPPFSLPRLVVTGGTSRAPDYRSYTPVPRGLAIRKEYGHQSNTVL